MVEQEKNVISNNMFYMQNKCYQSRGGVTTSTTQWHHASDGYNNERLNPSDDMYEVDKPRVLLRCRMTRVLFPTLAVEL